MVGERTKVKKGELSETLFARDRPVLQRLTYFQYYTNTEHYK